MPLWALKQISLSHLTLISFNWELSVPSMKEDCKIYMKFRFTKFKVQGDTKKAMSKFVGHSEGQGVAEFLPN